MKLQNVWRLMMLLGICALAGGNARADLTTGLAGYWQFNGNGTDGSGHGRDLAFSGGSFGAGLLGQALHLPKDNNQYAYRPVSDAAFDFGSSDFTVQVWVNYVSTQDEQVLIEKFTGGGGPGWTFTKLYDGYDQQGDAFHVWVSYDAFLLSDPIAITTGVWHHLVARRSGERLEVFYDNQSIATLLLGDFSIPPSENGLIIGKRNDGDGRDFSLNGALDEIAIWNRALSDAEINTLYNGGRGYALPSATVSGTITLEDCINSAQPLTFEFRPTDNSGNFQRTAALGAHGAFSLTGIPRKTYALWIKGEKWLAKTVAVNASNGDVSNVSALLLAGDANGDNSVDVLDLDALIQAFDALRFEAHWNEQADFNCDDAVDVLDLDLLIRNFDQTGHP